ncbi:hypothetical protein [Ruegeria profundi]|uniref:hypothetical protein n=1 Tax=Ruegeria profundi TaxID=1685378 RepID=UPI001CD1B3CE|nr:hypothetical protein [Ruegeria profundi]
MPSPSKIVTCCYCGTRAALVLRGQKRHELSCSSCGAPLHDIKMVPKRKLNDEKIKRDVKNAPTAYRKNKKKKRKAIFSRFLEEAWDVVEDIFD